MLRRKDYKYVNYPEIGTVFFEKSRRAKRVSIAIKSPTQVRVAVPLHISIKRAEKFVEQKLNWIKARVQSLKQKTNVLQGIDKNTSAERQALVEQVEYFAERYNFKFNKIIVRKMKSRWGSCSEKNNISLNIGLVNLPPELRDYVILHELVHTTIKNHSAEFWSRLASILPNAKELNRRLNREFGLFDTGC